MSTYKLWWQEHEHWILVSLTTLADLSSNKALFSSSQEKKNAVEENKSFCNGYKTKLNQETETGTEANQEKKNLMIS